MRLEDREALRRRFDFRCGYCGVSENDVGAELTIDHFHPRSHGGPDEPANWVYACFTCNNHKGDTWAPDLLQRVLHPVDDDLAEHIVTQPDGTVVGLTETGRFHIDQLQLNRPPLVAHRRALQREDERRAALEAALEQQEVLRQRVAALEQALAEAEHHLRSL